MTTSVDQWKINAKYANIFNNTHSHYSDRTVGWASQDPGLGQEHMKLSNVFLKLFDSGLLPD